MHWHTKEVLFLSRFWVCLLVSRMSQKPLYKVPPWLNNNNTPTLRRQHISTAARERIKYVLKSSFGVSKSGSVSQAHADVVSTHLNDNNPLFTIIFMSLLYFYIPSREVDTRRSHCPLHSCSLLMTRFRDNNNKKKWFPDRSRSFYSSLPSLPVVLRWKKTARAERAVGSDRGLFPHHSGLRFIQKGYGLPLVKPVPSN